MRWDFFFDYFAENTVFHVHMLSQIMSRHIDIMEIGNAILPFMPYAIRRPLTLDERNRIGGGSDIVARLLFHRGIIDAETAGRFLLPDYDTQVHDPFLLKDAEKAAARILEAMKNEERIAIYSDYDADGIPAAVVFNDFFNRIGYKNFSIYIPHRHDEGFGLNIEAVEQLAGEGVKLLITLDCGISDVEPVKRANKLGVSVVI